MFELYWLLSYLHEPLIAPNDNANIPFLFFLFRLSDTFLFRISKIVVEIHRLREKKFIKVRSKSIYLKG